SYPMPGDISENPSPFAPGNPTWLSSPLNCAQKAPKKHSNRRRHVISRAERSATRGRPGRPRPGAAAGITGAGPREGTVVADRRRTVRRRAPPRRGVLLDPPGEGHDGPAEGDHPQQGRAEEGPQ